MKLLRLVSMSLVESVSPPMVFDGIVLFKENTVMLKVKHFDVLQPLL